jgi:hypothetical protein
VASGDRRANDRGKSPADSCSRSPQRGHPRKRFAILDSRPGIGYAICLLEESVHHLRIKMLSVALLDFVKRLLQRNPRSPKADLEKSGTLRLTDYGPNREFTLSATSRRSQLHLNIVPNGLKLAC